MHSSDVLWPTAKGCQAGGAMKETVEPVLAERSQDPEAFANRKLIRPSLGRNDHNHAPNHSHPAAPAGEHRERPGRGALPAGGRKIAPPDQTNAENFYYQKQMQSKTPMVIVLGDGEEVHGVIEWYDKWCLKVNRNGAPNLLIYKPAIKYLYKEGENSRK
jgi:host factor-I protein